MENTLTIAAQGASPDFTDAYNTPLSPNEEEGFQDWVSYNSRKTGRDVGRDVEDYDLRGWWKQNDGKPLTPNAHLTDAFKKPNHPTFSTESKYNGVDGNEGGSWVKSGDQWTFRAGATNLKMYTPDQLHDYFRRADPDSKLILPGAQ